MPSSRPRSAPSHALVPFSFLVLVLVLVHAFAVVVFSRSNLFFLLLVGPRWFWDIS